MRIVAVLGLVALIAFACGGEPGPLTADEEAVVAAFDAQIALESAGTEEPFTDAETRRCFAEGVVRRLGVTRLAELGVAAAGVSDSLEVFAAMAESEVERTARIAVECTDLRAIFVEVGEMRPDAADCFSTRLVDSGTYEDLVLAGLRDEEPSNDVLADMLTAASGCLTPAEISDFFGQG